MDKIGILRDLSNSNCFPLLTNGELKLYILLIVNLPDAEVSGRIEIEQIEKANGKSLAFTELKSMMDSLEKHGLATMNGIIEGHAGKGGEMRFRLKRPVSV
ncbi:MAG: hypothetical protein AABZ28_06295 [Nitrospinota bacterium]|jgi:hypothetical protein